MNDDDKKNEIQGQISEQKSEKRKRKKRRGKASQSSENITSNPQEEKPLVTISSIITDENSKLPIKDTSINNQVKNTEQNPAKLRKRKKEKNDDVTEDQKEKSDLLTKARTMASVNEQITYIPEDLSLNKEDDLNERTKSEVIERDKKGIFLKRANYVDNEEGSKKEEIRGIIPSKDIDPKKLISIDEEDGELDYLEAEKAYELSVFLDSHKFIKKNNNFDKKFEQLVKRKIIRYERNLLELSQNDNFFILYELQVTETTELCLTDIATLNAIKSVFISYPSVHLIIILSDEEFLNKNLDKYDYSLVKEFATQKLANVLIYLDLDSDNEKRIHSFSIKKFKTQNPEFENQKKKIKELIDKPKVRKLFNLTTKEEEKNDSLLDYPCYLSVATNPSIYTKYIPDITSDYRCLIINSIFFMNRYQLCFDAAKTLSFTEPAVIALKIVPPLKGVDGREAFCDLNQNDAILSSDENISLNKKIMQVGYGEENANNPNTDVACQYLGFLEEDNDNYDDMIKRFKEGKIDKSDVRIKVFNLFKDIFKIFREKDINDIDTNKIMIK